MILRTTHKVVDDWVDGAVEVTQPVRHQSQLRLEEHPHVSVPAKHINKLKLSIKFTN